MDFQTRFQGKTSMISKDGSIDAVVSSTKAPINKVDINSITHTTIGIPQDQIISYSNQTNTNGFPNYNTTQKNQQFSSIGMRTGMSNPYQYQQPTQTTTFEYASPSQNSFSPIKKSTNLEDLRADNIYLLGGNNMAEALYKRAEDTNYSQSNEGTTGATTSIAMRMKRNKEAQQQQQQTLTQDQFQVSNPFGSNQNQDQQQQQQYWASTGYSDHSHHSSHNQMQTPMSTSQSQRRYNQEKSSSTLQDSDNQTTNTVPQQTNNKNGKPPSQQNMRKSVEKQRQTNFANVSKQIIKAPSGSQRSKPAAKLNGNFSKQQSYIDEKQINQQKDENQIHKIRSASVNASIAMTNLNEKPNVLQKKSTVQRTIGNKFLRHEVTSADPKSQKAPSSQQIENPYTPLQLQPLPQNQPGQLSLSPEQIQQQIQFMQHQMMLLQQQQQFIMSGTINQINPPSSFKPAIGLPPQSSPAIQQASAQTNVYNQFDLADQKYQESKNNKPQSSITQPINKSSQSTLPTSNTTTGVYKPYSVKEYKQKVQQQQISKLGGLGANIGSDEWEKAKKKQEQLQEYARQLRMQNQIKPPTQKKKEDNKPKEKTARDKALEFARNNIPKPKQRNLSNQDLNYGQELYVREDDEEDEDYFDYENQNSGSANVQGKQLSKYLSEDLNGIEEEPFDENGVTLKEVDLATLNKKHDAYASEIERIKEMIM